MTEGNTGRAINYYRITPEDWQIYVKKIFKDVPGSRLQDKHNWLAVRLGVTPGTTGAWLNKGEGVPSSESQSATAELLEIPLSILVTQVQQRLDPPLLNSGVVSKSTIRAIANIPPDEIELLAKSLSDVTQAEFMRAMVNLGAIAQNLLKL
jgi:hypothetical protein